MAISPTAEGFRATFHQPSFTLAEIAWRWVFGATAIALFFFGLFEYLDTLPVTNRELLFLRTKQPFLVAQAIAHILRGSLYRAVMSLLLAFLLLSVLWIVAASLGRIATVRALTAYFRDMAGRLSPVDVHEPDENKVASDVSTGNFVALLRLNFLRIALGVALVLGLLAADIIAGFVSTPKNPEPGLAFILFVPIAALVFLFAWVLNWLISLAGLFAVRDGDSAVAAISSAVSLCRERAGAVFAVSTWTGLAHLVAFVAATTVVSMVVGFMPLLPLRLGLFVVMLVTIAYFALADWLYMARLAGYVCILDIPDALMKPAPPMPHSVPPVPTIQSTIDRDELILSDVPPAVIG
jgi:hypothetical protein